MTENTSATARVRLDKWLWVARFFKTRGLSAEEIGKGRVEVNGQAAKASRELRPGDTIELRQGPVTRALIVKALSLQRGPASVAQALYEETPESVTLREKAAQERRSGSDRRWHWNRAARPSATGASWPTGTAGARRATPTERHPAGFWPGDADRPQSPLETVGSPPHVNG